MVDALLAPGLSTVWHVDTERRRIVLLTVLAVAASLLCAAMVVQLELVSIAVVIVAVGLACMVWRPQVGLYSAFVLVALFEDGNADPMMQPGIFLHNGLGNALGLPGVIPSPLELLLILTVVIWLAQGVARRERRFQGGQLARPMLLFVFAWVAGVVRGMVGGADIRYVLWEARFLLYMPVCYMLASNMIRTTRDVKAMTTVGLLGMAAFAVEGAYRRVALIDTGQFGTIMEWYYAHESIVFLVSLLLLVLSQQVFGGPRWQKVFGIAMFVVGGYTLLATERRSGYIAFIVAFLAFTVVFLVVHRKAFALISVPVLLVGAIYLPVFWNNTSLLGQPARAVRSMYQPDPRDAASNAARDAEKINIRATIAANPLMGVGFGREYLFVVPTVDLSWWPLARYETHANILWIWMKMGVIGFIALWVLMGAAVARAAYLTRNLHDSNLRAFALMSLGCIITVLTFCYVDLGFTAGRIPVFLGTILGTLAVLDQVRDTETA
jgi:hypothetical protein